MNNNYDLSVIETNSCSIEGDYYNSDEYLKLKAAYEPDYEAYHCKFRKCNNKKKHKHKKASNHIKH